MKKVTIKNLLLILSAGLLFSCKPTLKVNTDYDRTADFSAYKTFGLHYLVTSRTVSQLNEERIWNSIRSTMSQKGYIEKDRNPDLVIHAISVVKNKNYLSATSSGYTGLYRPYGYWGGSATTTVQTNQYKEGSLVINVVDAKTNRLIWEGIGNAEFEKTPKNPDEAISNAVTKIMTGFPAEHEKTL